MTQRAAPSCPLSRLRERAGVRARAHHFPTLTPALSRPAGEGEIQN
jgi:hypothetical protein